MFYKGIIESQQYAARLRTEDIVPDHVEAIKEAW